MSPANTVGLNLPKTHGFGDTVCDQFEGCLDEIKRTVGVHKWRVYLCGTAAKQNEVKLTAKEIKRLRSYPRLHRKGQETIRELLSLMPRLADLANNMDIDPITSMYRMADLNRMATSEIPDARIPLKRLESRIRKDSNPDSDSDDSHAPYIPMGWFQDEFGVTAQALRGARRRDGLKTKKQPNGRNRYSVPDSMHLSPIEVPYSPEDPALPDITTRKKAAKKATKSRGGKSPFLLVF